MGLGQCLMRVGPRGLHPPRQDPMAVVFEDLGDRLEDPGP